MSILFHLGKLYLEGIISRSMLIKLLKGLNYSNDDSEKIADFIRDTPLNVMKRAQAPRCGYCGSRHEEGEKFCNKCGAPLD